MFESGTHKRNWGRSDIYFATMISLSLYSWTRITFEKVKYDKKFQYDDPKPKRTEKDAVSWVQKSRKSA